MYFIKSLLMMMMTTSSTTKRLNVFDNIGLLTNDDEDDIAISDSEESEESGDEGISLNGALYADKDVYSRQTSDEKITTETKELLQSHSSQSTQDKNNNNNNELKVSPTSSKIVASNSKSILGTKHVVDALPIVQNCKPKKAVRFDMEKNETCEIVQPELNDEISSDDDDDIDFSTNDNENNSQNKKQCVIRNVRFVSDLESSDDDEINDEKRHVGNDKSEPKNNSSKLQNGFHENNNSEKNRITDDIGYIQTERKDLLDEITELRETHEKEMKKLHEEYRRRREDYYTELDEVRMEIDEKRSKFQSEANTAHANDDPTIKALRQHITQEKDNLEAQEKELTKRKTEISEQEQELKEYQRYLDRRHKTLNGKEEDLCTLQDELEELDDELKAKKEELLKKKETLEVTTTVSKQCSHDEREIERTKIELIDSLKTEANLRDHMRAKDDDAKKNLERISQLEDENKKLLSKVRILESQLTINLKSSSSGTSLADRRTSLRVFSSIPVDEKTGEYIMPRGIASRNSPISPLISPLSSSTNSPALGHRNIKSPNSSPLHNNTQHVTAPVAMAAERSGSRESIPSQQTNQSLVTSPVVSKTCSIM